MTKSRNAQTSLRGTCPVCFREMPVLEAMPPKGIATTKPRYVIGRHGWREAGGRQVGVYNHAWHEGECFGVGWAPFEVSPEGTRAYVERVLFPRALGTMNELAWLATRPALIEHYVERIYLHEPIEGHARGWLDCPYEARFVPGDQPTERGLYSRRPGRAFPGYDAVHETRTNRAQGFLDALMRDGRTLLERAAAWVAGELRTAEPKGPVVHYHAPGARKPACVRLRYPHGMRTTDDPSKATCGRCRKALGLS